MVVVLDNEGLRGTHLLKPKLGQEQSYSGERWVPGDFCNADVQLGAGLARSVAGCWVVVHGYAILPREHWTAILLSQQAEYSYTHCSTRAATSYIFSRSTCTAGIIICTQEILLTRFP